MNKLVSIIVPIYGVEDYIENCVISLMEQTYSDIEYVFVDDCTKDNSVKILERVIEKYPLKGNRVKIIKHLVNKGLSAARNTGLLSSTGDYIVHVDSDDYVEIDFVEQCVKRLDESDADIVFVDRRFIYANLIKTSQLLTYNNISEWKHDMLSGKFPHSVWGCLIKKSLYTDNNILAVEGLHQGEDFAVMCRLAHYVNKIEIVNRPLYNYLIRTNIYNYSRKNLDDICLSWKVVDDFYQNTQEYEKVKGILWLRMLSFYIWQIRCWVTGTKMDRGEAEIIKETFPPLQNYSEIGMLKRMVLLLFKYNYFKSLKFYITIVASLQKLTRRRGNIV